MYNCCKKVDREEKLGIGNLSQVLVQHQGFQCLIYVDIWVPVMGMCDGNEWVGVAKTPKLLFWYL